MVKCLVISGIAILFSGCCSVPPHVPFECPDRPVFEDYSSDLWNALPEDAKLNISADDLAMKDYIKSCEARAEIHND